MNKTSLIIGLLCVAQSFAQSISMEFPAFAGKTYDFIIFQGSKTEAVIRDTIPKNGKFTLTIPQKYTPYTGMCRWLITGSEEGGGLDMAIPGHDFSVSCSSSKPDNANIVYKGFDAVNELNRLNIIQQTIIDKFETMSRAAQLYDKTSLLYGSFQKEKERQKQAYNIFQKELKKNPSFSARFLPIVNLTRGFPNHLTDDQKEKTLLANEFITKELDFGDLYVSGHWEAVIQNWVILQMSVVNNKVAFVRNFKCISDRIKVPAQYTDFVGKLTHYLIQYGKDDYVEGIASTVLDSGKVTEYLGSMQVYQKSMIGMQAPDLFITGNTGKQESHKPQASVIKSKDFAQGKYTKTLLIFYRSGCDPCEELLQQLPGKYEDLKKKGIDLITISADENQQVFENISRNFPWKRSYCDLQGIKGVNFKNYGVIGTPTLYLIDKMGKIEKRLADLPEVLKVL